MPVEPAAVRLLSDLTSVLDRWGRWYVFGAQAVVAHGVPRLSADVDVTLWMDRDDPEGLAADMSAAGFALRVEDPEFVRRTRVMPFVHVSTPMPLDVVLAASGLEESFLDRAKEMDLGRVKVPVIDAADLIVARILAGCPKEVEDARQLWRVCGRSLDAESIRETLSVLEAALSQSDLVPSFEAIRQSSSG